jgi:hypothetical protein
MNNYKKLINIIKPEFQDLYAITKNIGEENTFQLAHSKMVDGNKKLDTMMNFRNDQNSMIVMKNGKNPYISDVSSVYSKDIYAHLNIPKEVTDFIYFTKNLNDRKHEMHLFFDNIFSGSGILRNHRYSTSVKIKVSKDYSMIDYIMIEHVYDVTFRKDNLSLKDSDPIKNYSLFGKIKTYVKKKDIIIDIHNSKIIIENIDNDEPVVETFSFDDFIKNDIFKVDEIKQQGKEYLQMKIDDIDAFEWSATDDN